MRSVGKFRALIPGKRERTPRPIQRPQGIERNRVEAAQDLAAIAHAMRRPGESAADALERAREAHPDLARLAVPAHPDDED